MIEIITDKVEMPGIDKRRYQRGKCIDPKGWEVIDTETGQVRWKGRYMESCLALHNLNKKHYQNKPMNNSTFINIYKTDTGRTISDQDYSSFENAFENRDEKGYVGTFEIREVVIEGDKNKEV